METARESLIGALSERVEELNEDELCILLTLADKMTGEGRSEYGPLDLEDDRDFGADAWDEATDAMFYCLSALLKAREWNS